MTENYIDLGCVLTSAPIVIFGGFLGGMHWSLATHASSIILSYAFATALLISAAQFEVIGTKLLGAAFARSLVFTIVLRVVIPRGALPRRAPASIGAGASPIPSCRLLVA